VNIKRKAKSKGDSLIPIVKEIKAAVAGNCRIEAEKG
jgi:hypothetical protein